MLPQPATHAPPIEPRTLARRQSSQVPL